MRNLCTENFSERVPQRELHYASGLGLIQWRLSGSEFAEIPRRAARSKERIRSQREIGNRQTIKPLSVGYIEHFPAELKRVTFPRHCERLVKSHVERNVPRRAQHVAIAEFARKCG